MTIFYPTELSQRLEVGVSVTPRGDPRSIKADHGPSFARGGSSSDPIIVSAAQTGTEIWQLARFNRFYEQELGFGGLRFWMPDQRFDGVPLMMPDTEIITMPDGAEPIENTAWWECQFIGRVGQPSVQFDFWRIAFALEVS